MGLDFSILPIKQSRTSSDSSGSMFELMFIRGTSQQREGLSLLKNM